MASRVKLVNMSNYLTVSTILYAGITDEINVEEIKGISSAPKIENSDWFRSQGFQVLDAIENSLHSSIGQSGCSKYNLKPVKIIYSKLLRPR